MMKKTKKILAMIMVTAMMLGAAFTVDAATYSLTKSCPACGQSNIHKTYESNFHCWKCNTDCRLYTFVCSRCSAVYKVCANGDLQ